MSCDLSQFQNTANAGEWLILTHPVTGEKLPMQLLVLSIESDKVKAIQRSAINSKLTKRTLRTTSETLEAEANTMLMATVLGWENFELDNKMLEFTPENLSMVLFSGRWPWIKKQLDDYVNAEINFTKVSK